MFKKRKQLIRLGWLGLGLFIGGLGCSTDTSAMERHAAYLERNYADEQGVLRPLTAYGHRMAEAEFTNSIDPYTDYQIIRALDDKQTAIAKLNEAFKNSKEDDINYLVIESHGYRGGIIDFRFNELKAILDSFEGHFVICITACMSGSAINRIQLPIELQKKWLSSDQLRYFESDSKYTVFCSSSKSQFSNMDPRFCYFTQTYFESSKIGQNGFLNADYNQDDVVTAKELAQYLESNGKTIEGTPVSQIPKPELPIFATNRFVKDSEEISEGDWKGIWDEKTGRYRLVDYTGDKSNVQVPTTFKNKPVEISLKSMLNELNLKGLNSFKTSGINKEIKVIDKDLTGLFQSAKAKSIDMRGLDTSNVINMEEMFGDCTNLTTLNLSTLDTSNVINMDKMFSNCTNLTTLDLSTFDTSNVTEMLVMFSNCTNLTTLNVGDFDTSNVRNALGILYGVNDCIIYGNKQSFADFMDVWIDSTNIWYEDIEKSVTDLFEDSTHTALKSGVDQAKIDLAKTNVEKLPDQDSSKQNLMNLISQAQNLIDNKNQTHPLVLAFIEKIQKLLVLDEKYHAIHLTEEATDKQIQDAYSETTTFIETHSNELSEKDKQLVQQLSNELLRAIHSELNKAANQSYEDEKISSYKQQMDNLFEDSNQQNLKKTITDSQLLEVFQSFSEYKSERRDRDKNTMNNISSLAEVLKNAILLWTNDLENKINDSFLDNEQTIKTTVTQPEIDDLKNKIENLSKLEVTQDRINKIQSKVQKLQQLFNQSQSQQSVEQTIQLGGQELAKVPIAPRVSLTVKDHKATITKNSNYRFHFNGWKTSKYASIKLTDPNGNILYNQQWNGNQQVKGNYGPIASVDLPEGSTVEIYHAEGPWHRFGTSDNDNLKTKLGKTGYTYTYTMQNNQLVLTNVQ
ncbi:MULTISPECIES: BspA family leucine-rich repeat surface protein [unclassified Enterococcus]|uniref:BspA family leucine-rich repeat surface protein n=1 Tax=unclassified Enterococcus TaxID=2608891 RepID=UPI0013EAA033|nr:MULTISPECIES: BspA family leucine-rich repeat surface protein [unclassified Enterococcus]